MREKAKLCKKCENMYDGKLVRIDGCKNGHKPRAYNKGWHNQKIKRRCDDYEERSER